MKEMNIFEREVGGRRYRIASQSVWDSDRQRPFARQVVLGPADPPPVADLALVRTIGTQRVGDAGALVWVAEQLDLIGLIDRACGQKGPEDGPTIGEMVVAVAIQRACAPRAKCHLAAFLESCLPRVSCLPASAFTGQAFHRLAAEVTEEQLEKPQIEIARAAVERFDLSTCVLAFDTTNFDTHIATTTAGELARRGKAKSKRSDLRVVGLAALVSETGHVPLLHRTYPGNGSDQTVLDQCLGSLGKLHRCFERCRANPGSGRPHAGARRRFMERTTGTGTGCGRLLHPALAAVESWCLGIGAAARGAARRDAAFGREVGRCACGALADSRWRCQNGPHAGGGGEPGTAARTEAGDRGGAAQGQGGVAQAGATGGEGPHPARGPGGESAEGAGPRAPVGVRDHHGKSGAWESIALLACRPGPTASAGTHAPGAAGLVYRPSCLEQRTHCLCLSGAVERRGTVPPGQEGRRCALGSFAPMVRQFVAVAHVRHGDRFDFGESG